jgi:alkanesulfonate monooxygenase SsuD/methylene tetrahydromethanopterin reductase-like flavin-dependent oxidoreductase (luciferase family)
MFLPVKWRVVERLTRVGLCRSSFTRRDPTMRYGLNLPNHGPAADIRAMADLARLAEDSGWDGFFVWDHVTWLRSDPRPVADVWVLLSAVAVATTRLRIGPMVSPIARRRPTKLARETASLDQLSGGRLTLGVGLGSPIDDEFVAVGEPGDPAVLAQRLDEGLDILNAAWSGQPVNYHGVTHHVDGVTFLPRPVQRPRIPVWVGGTWPRRRPTERALRWDGAVFTYLDPTPTGPAWRSATPAEVAELATLARNRPAGTDDFDIVVGGDSWGADAHLVEPLAAAGATWWQESLASDIDTWDDVVRRVRRGPPHHV